MNRENFNKLKTPTVDYHSIDDFNWNPQHEHLKQLSRRNTDGTLVACRDHRLEPEVILRVGMLVVLQVNLSISAGLCNGSQGIICGFEDYDPKVLPRAKRKDDMLPPWQIINGDYAALREMQIARFRATKWPVVKFQNGKTRTIFANCMVNSYGKEPYSLLHRTQIPLLPGWAISVHMSQGMTLNRVIVNLSNAFAEGQVYVALSRATSLEGLKIDGDSEGLAVGKGGNEDVREFLLEKFGKGLFDDHVPDSASFQRSLDSPSPSGSLVELDD